MNSCWVFLKRSLAPPDTAVPRRSTWFNRRMAASAAQVAAAQAAVQEVGLSGSASFPLIHSESTT